MTFDFTPSWQDPATATHTAVDVAVAALDASTVIARPERAPAHPGADELALLVRELFAEGSLSWDQLQALSRVAELKPMLEPALAGIPATRRVAGARR